MCIFCALRPQVQSKQLLLPLRSLHSSSRPYRPVETNAFVSKEGVQSNASQEARWTRFPRDGRFASKASSSQTESQETSRSPQHRNDRSLNVPSSNLDNPLVRRTDVGSIFLSSRPRRTREYDKPKPPQGFNRQDIRQDWRSQSSEYNSEKWSQQRIWYGENSRRSPGTDNTEAPQWSQLRRRSQASSRDTYPGRSDRRGSADFVSFHNDGGGASSSRAVFDALQPSINNRTERKDIPLQSFVESRSFKAPGHDMSVGAMLESDVLPSHEPLSEETSRWHDSKTKFEKKPSRRGRFGAELDEDENRDTDRGRKKGRNGKGRRREEDEDDDSLMDKFISEEAYEEFERARQLKKERKRQRKLEKGQEPVKPSGPQIILPEFISIGQLATALKTRVEAFSNKLADLGFEDFSHSHIIDGETAGLIAIEFNFNPIIPSRHSEDDLVALPPPSDASVLASRPPVITIMGHVDHGKTTLLDWLRKSSVAANEHGGITQHIGAFTVPMPSGRVITFLDTPGHAAFLNMRARGANVTDIVILVVAADDSVKPQTLEAIKHAKAAKVPIIVAINKMDKEDADAQRVKQDLARYGIEVEDFGGDTQTVAVSGKTGLGMEELEESVLAQADILDVRADTNGQVEGWVIEATSKKSGKVATVLVKRGTLKVGDVVVAGQTWTRVRTLRNESGAFVDSATPGTPVEVDGWREQPEAGAEVIQAPDEQRARRAVAFREERAESEKLAADVIAVNETRRAEEVKKEHDKAREQAMKKGELERARESETSSSSAPITTEVPFVLRADVAGSVEAVQASLLALGNSEVRASVLRASFGPLSPFDVEYAATAGGHLISFNQVVPGEIVRMAERAGVKILDNNIIYRLTDDVRSLLEEKLPPNITTRVTGEAEIAQIFEITVKGRKKMPVAGCKVRNGLMSKGSKAKITREDKLVYNGKSSLLFSTHLRTELTAIAQVF